MKTTPSITAFSSSRIGTFPLSVRLALSSLAVFLAACLGTASLAFASLPESSVGDSRGVIVEAGEFADRDLLSLGGKIVVRGVALRDVVTYGGDIEIYGEVKGSVMALGGEIHLVNGSRVEGDVVCIAGSLKREDGSYVEAKIYSIPIFEEFFRGVFEAAPGDLFRFNLSPQGFYVQLLYVFGWLIAALLVTALAPGPVMVAERHVAYSPVFTFGIGVLSLIALALGAIGSAFLVFILIGIPIMLILVFLMILAKVFGSVVIFHWLGRMILRPSAHRRASMIQTVVLGLAIVSLFRFTPPAIRILVLMVTTCMGFGAVALSRFGSRMAEAPESRLDSDSLESEAL